MAAFAMHFGLLDGADGRRRNKGVEIPKQTHCPQNADQAGELDRFTMLDPDYRAEGHAGFPGERFLSLIAVQTVAREPVSQLFKGRAIGGVLCKFHNMRLLSLKLGFLASI